MLIWNSCRNKKGVAALHVAESLKSKGSLITKRKLGSLKTRLIVVVIGALEVGSTWALRVFVPVRIVPYIDLPVVGVKIFVVVCRDT